MSFCPTPGILSSSDASKLLMLNAVRVINASAARVTTSASEVRSLPGCCLSSSLAEHFLDHCGSCHSFTGRMPEGRLLRFQVLRFQRRLSGDSAGTRLGERWLHRYDENSVSPLRSSSDVRSRGFSEHRLQTGVGALSFPCKHVQAGLERIYCICWSHCAMR